MKITDLCKSQEDYIKVISRISGSNHAGWVSNSEIADELRVKPSSVTNMLYKLKELGVITWTPRKAIRLTEKGREVAEMLNDRYKTLLKFFSNLFDTSNYKIMKTFCCEIEHNIPQEIYEEMIRINRNQNLMNHNKISIEQ